MASTTILFHAHCADGMAAALAAYLALGDDDVRYISLAYSAALPTDIERGTDVYFLDVTVKRQTMLALAQLAGRITVIDHHASARADLDGISDAALNTLGACEIRTVFDQAHSGCVLAWQHFHRGRHVPRLFSFIEDRDLWTFALPGSKELHYAIDTTDSFIKLAKLLDDGHLVDAIAIGAEILNHLRQQWQHIASRAGLLDLDDHALIVCNCPPQWFSDVGHLLLEQHPDADIAALYFDTVSTGRRTYSLRSRADGPDVSVIADSLGGGGHPRAAGFSVESFNADALWAPIVLNAIDQAA
jgi:uncharacterized protein